jgi:hypothetical protein
MLSLTAVLGFAVVATSVELAIALHDQHWVQRGGALLAALAAFLAIFEAFVEHRVQEHAASRPKELEEKGLRRELLTMAQRIKQARFRSAHIALSGEKLRTVFFISSIAIAGEILHGFGDLIFLEVAYIFGWEFHISH